MSLNSKSGRFVNFQIFFINLLPATATLLLIKNPFVFFVSHFTIFYFHTTVF